MTYEDALEWIIDNINSDDYDNFADWYDKAFEKLATPNLFNSPNFNRMLEDYWLGSYGRYDLREPQEQPLPTPESRGLELGIPENEQRGQTEPRIPPTGQAPTIPKPVLVFPDNIQQKEKKGFINRVKDAFRFLRRKK